MLRTGMSCARTQTDRSNPRKGGKGPTSEYLGLKGAVLVASDRNAHVRNNLELHDERCEGGRCASCAIDWRIRKMNYSKMIYPTQSRCADGFASCCWQAMHRRER
jgi:hypothetical protein